MGKKSGGTRERDRAATRSRHLLVAAESTYGGSFGWDSCAVVVLAVASSCWMMMMQMIYGAHTMIAWAMSDSHAPLSLLFRATVFFFSFSSCCCSFLSTSKNIFQNLRLFFLLLLRLP